MSTSHVRPELLAPAGDWDCLRAAVENGADAVYFGLDSGFNARARAANFPVAELPQILAFLHQRGVKGYVTVNTLVFSDELAEVERLVRAIAQAGADAVLVQDLGLVRLIRTLCPELSIHASTQMTLTSAECIELVHSLGVERAVLARELSVDEIDAIHQHTEMPVEAFVHGALCVAYSGQCLTSESLGGRSANRGQCAQACRLPYELVCDGQDVDLGSVKYLLSPQDLAAYELIDRMIAAGVCCFKVEGRLKTPEYVANITRHYRRAIDQALAGRKAKFTTQDVREMELSFSRGFSPGWLNGCDHKMLVPGLSSAKRGVLLGEVQGVRNGRILVELTAPVARGDGVVLAGDREEKTEQGGRVIGVYRHHRQVDEPVSSGVVALAFHHDTVDLDTVWSGQQIWKTDDPQLTQRLRKTFTGPDPLRRVPLDLDIEARAGGSLRIVGRAENQACCDVAWNEPLEVARKHPLSVDLLRQQLGRLGGTVFTLRDLRAEIAGSPMVPLSVLGKLRHQMVEQLERSIVDRPPRQLMEGSALEMLREPIQRSHHASTDAASDRPRLHVLCRTLEQLDVVLSCEPDSVMVDFQDIRQYREAVPIARRAARPIYLATPRIQKPGEMGIFHAMLRHEADGVLARNLAAMAYFFQHQLDVIADFSLNATNELTVQLLKEWGARRVTASYDLNRDQMMDLVQATPPTWLEVVLHQHMPMFHMEHCVFCAVLSPGTNKTNCGRPCDDHLVQLRDRVGMEHPLKADVGCRNTLFNAVAQSGSEVAPALLQHGVRDFRVELLDDSARDIPSLLGLYRDLLNNRITGQAVWKKLNAHNRIGVTRGTLEAKRDPLAIL